MDTRAQSIGLSRYILAFIIGAIVIWIVDLVTTPILAGATNATNNQTANTATQWFTQWISWLPMAFLLIGFTGLIVYSIFIRETLGR